MRRLARAAGLALDAGEYADVPAEVAAPMAEAHGGRAEHVYEVALDGFSFRGSSEGAEALSMRRMAEELGVSKANIDQMLSSPNPDIKRLVGLYQDGRLKLNELATRSYSFDQVNAALAALDRGDGGRGILIP